jgi:hypothetical protein
MYPRFYIKNVGGEYTITHRLSHSFIISVDNEKDLVIEMKELCKMSDEEFWRYMIYDKKIRIPNNKASVISKDTKDNEHEEEWFRNAWSIYTDLFYTRNPKLLVVEETFPQAIINKIRREHYELEKVAEQKRKDEIAEAERLAKLDEHVERKTLKKKTVVKEVPEGKLGSVGALEKMQKRKKKLLKKVKIKTKSNMVFDILDSDDPFA